MESEVRGLYPWTDSLRIAISCGYGLGYGYRRDKRAIFLKDFHLGLTWYSFAFEHTLISSYRIVGYSDNRNWHTIGLYTMNSRPLANKNESEFERLHYNFYWLLWCYNYKYCFYLFNSAYWAIHISWSKCCLSVCLHVSQGDTNGSRCTQRLVIMHPQTY